MKKQILAIILVIVTVIGIIPLSSMSVYADSEIPEFNVNDAEIYIDSEEDFIEFGKAIEADKNFEGKVVHITKDIDLRDEDGNYYEWYSVIGNEKGFYGIIDGHGHCLQGIKLDASNLATGKRYVGIFGGRIFSGTAPNNKYDNAYAGVFNLSIINSMVSVVNRYAGALFGCVEANASDKVLFENLYIDVDITSTEDTIGGLIGYNRNTNTVIDHCVFAGDITIANDVGELAGIGGFVGYNGNGKKDVAQLTIRNSAFHGNIKYSATKDFGGFASFVGINGTADTTNLSAITINGCISTYDFDISATKSNWGVCVGTSLNGTVPTVTNVLSTYQGAPDADKYTYVAPSELQGIDAQIPANSEFVTVPNGNPLPMGVVNLVRKINLSDAENTLPTLFYGQQSTALTIDTKSTLRIIGGMNGELTDYDALGMEITMITENGKKWTNRKSDNTLPVITTVYDSVYGGGEEYHADTCDYLFVACVGGIKANVGELRFVVKTFHDKNNTRVYDDVYIITYDTTITVTE